MDKIDIELVKILQENARRSSASIARQLNVSSGNIRYRIRKLLKSGDVRIVATIKQSASDLPIIAILTLLTDRSKTEQIFNEVVNMPEIFWASIVTGRCDIIISARFASMTKLLESQNRINSIDGVRESETLISMKNYNRVFGVQEV